MKNGVNETLAKESNDMQYETLRNRLVEIRLRGGSEADSYPGFLMDESPDLVSILRWDDFFLDGYEVFKKEWILSLEEPKHPFLEAATRSEGILRAYKKPPHPCISSEDEFLKQACERRAVICAQWFDDDDTCLTLGYVLRVFKHTFTMMSITCGAVLEKRPERLRKDEVFGYQYGDRYSRIYGKYAREEK